MSVTELTPDDFVAQRFAHIFERVWKEEAAQPFDAVFFFPQWRMLMGGGIARTWAASDSAVLGALFVRDTFSGLLRTGVQFWFCLPEMRHTGVSGKLMGAFENAAKTAGALDMQAGAHQKLNPSRREYQYLQHGFVKSETIYLKAL